MFGGKMNMEKWRFWRQETTGRPKVLNKAAKIVLKKALYNIGDSTRKLSHNKQAESRKGREKLFKIRSPWNGKKRSLCLVCEVTPNSSQICKEYKSLAVEGGRYDYLF